MDTVTHVDGRKGTTLSKSSMNLETEVNESIIKPLETGVIDLHESQRCGGNKQPCLETCNISCVLEICLLLCHS